MKNFTKLRFLAGKITQAVTSEMNFPHKCSLPRDNLTLGKMGQVSTKDRHV